MGYRHIDTDIVLAKLRVIFLKMNFRAVLECRMSPPQCYRHGGRQACGIQRSLFHVVNPEVLEVLGGYEFVLATHQCRLL